MYCRKEMVKILKCYLISKKLWHLVSLSKGAIFFLANPVYGRVKISFSNILEKEDNIKIGRKFACKRLSPTLSIGITFSIFNESGKILI